MFAGELKALFCPKFAPTPLDQLFSFKFQFLIKGSEKEPYPFKVVFQMGRYMVSVYKFVNQDWKVLYTENKVWFQVWISKPMALS